MSKYNGLTIKMSDFLKKNLPPTTYVNNIIFRIYAGGWFDAKDFFTKLKT